MILKRCHQAGKSKDDRGATEKERMAPVTTSSRDEKAAKEARVTQEKLRGQIKQLHSELDEAKTREQASLDVHKTKVI